MDKLKAKKAGLERRQRRVRSKVTGTAARPRMRITRSDSNIYVQIIDDVAANTLVSASTLDSEIRKSDAGWGGNVAAAKLVGELIGKRAVEAGITEVVFDRGGNLYHGRVKALADGARGAGLKF